jgi:hypothetical protein
MVGNDRGEEFQSLENSAAVVSPPFSLFVLNTFVNGYDCRQPNSGMRKDLHETLRPRDRGRTAILVELQ